MQLTPYRPISTLYSFAQIFEKLVYLQVSTCLEKYDIPNKFQFGFRKGRSTEQAIVEISDNLKKAIDNNLYTCGVFLDFAKAFDTVNHQILVKEIETYGIRGIPLKWFSSYLFKDGAYYCYCAYVLRISRYSSFLSVMLTNTGIFLRGLKLSGESR